MKYRVFNYCVNCKITICQEIMLINIHTFISTNGELYNYKLRITHGSTTLHYLYIMRRGRTLTDTHQCNMKWLSFLKRCQFKLLCLTHKTLFLGRPVYLLGLLTFRNILPHMRSPDATLLDLPVTRNVMRSRSFTSMAPTTWNLLPYRLRRLKSPHVFANSLKEYLNLNLK